MHEVIARGLKGFGGHLKCSVCGYSEKLGDISGNLANGWPKHCGYTMTWLTAKILSDTNLNNNDKKPNHSIGG